MGFEASLGRRRFSPAPAGSYAGGVSPVGCVQMGGDVWEWTSSHFKPYPGFLAFPYPEYSEIFFGDTYRVLRGGSWATDPLVARFATGTTLPAAALRRLPLRPRRVASRAQSSIRRARSLRVGDWRRSCRDAALPGNLS